VRKTDSSVVTGVVNRSRRMHLFVKSAAASINHEIMRVTLGT
jgi:hypothetical protein